jgi:hypothetical protein
MPSLSASAKRALWILSAATLLQWILTLRLLKRANDWFTLLESYTRERIPSFSFEQHMSAFESIPLWIARYPNGVASSFLIVALFALNRAQISKPWPLFYTLGCLIVWWVMVGWISLF